MACTRIGIKQNSKEELTTRLATVKLSVIKTNVFPSTAIFISDGGEVC